MAPATQNGLCLNCTTHLLPTHQDCCLRCGLPLNHAADICGHCLQAPPAYDYTRVGRIYAWPVAHLIHAFKYGHAYGLAGLLCDSLNAATPLPDVFLPMPQHPLRLRERGYDQTRLLAAELSRRHKRPMLDRACHRIRNTRSQTGLALSQRKANLHGAFACQGDVRGLHVAVVDDVMTTGSSMQELAVALRAAGAATIGCWIMARALPPGTR